MARGGKSRAKSKKSLKRRAARLDVPDRVLIVTEGSRTEPVYFRKLIAELGLTTAKVSIIGDGGSAPVSVVKHAMGILQHDPRFEQVYLVFDKDRHDSYDAALEMIRGLARKRDFRKIKIVAVTSVPCFEIWFMMHVSPSRKPYESAKPGGSPSKALLADLVKNEVFSGYAKGECAEFEVIAPHRETARSCAESFLTQARAEGATEFHENPSTRVHLVVGALETLSKVNKTE